MDINAIALVVSMVANLMGIMAGIYGACRVITSRQRQRPQELPIIVIVLAIGLVAFGPVAQNFAGITTVGAAVGQLLLLPATLGAVAFCAAGDIVQSNRPLSSLIGRVVEVHGIQTDLEGRRYEVRERGRIREIDESSVVIDIGPNNRIVLPRSDVRLMEVRNRRNDRLVREQRSDPLADE